VKRSTWVGASSRLERRAGSMGGGAVPPVVAGAGEPVGTVASPARGMSWGKVWVVGRAVAVVAARARRTSFVRGDIMIRVLRILDMEIEADSRGICRTRVDY
jgi:hypothetical protein